MNKIINGDSLKVLKKLEDESVDLICTDPPYGYSFMNRDWDKAVPALEIWQECLRVLKREDSVLLCQHHVRMYKVV